MESTLCESESAKKKAHGKSLKIKTMKYKSILLLFVAANIYGQTNEFGYSVAPGEASAESVSVGSLGGAFNVSPTGAATYSIPIEVPAGVGGMQPSLSIVYNSQAGNGILGWGYSLSGISTITRAPKDIFHDGTAKGTTHSADEAYYLDGQRLIFESGTAGQPDAVYHPESDPFTKVTVKYSNSRTWFEVLASNGMKYHYGESEGLLFYYIPELNYATKTHAWYIDYVEDPLGNYMTYSYHRFNYTMYPHTITYGNNTNQSNSILNTIVFNLVNRSDAPYFPIENNIQGMLCSRIFKITCKTGENVFRTYDLEYNFTSDSYSRLTSVTVKNGAGEALKPTVFTWNYLPAFSQTDVVPQGFDYLNFITGNIATNFNTQYFSSVDLNGDGVSDIVSFMPNGSNQTLSQHYIAKRQNDGTYRFEADPSTVKYLPSSIDVINSSKWEQTLGGQSAFNAIGDGRQYILVPLYVEDTNKRIIFFIYGLEGNSTPTYSDAITLNSGGMPVYVTGDIYNEGKDNIIFIENGKTNNKYPLKIVKVTSFNSSYKPNLSYKSIEVPLPQPPQKMFVSDYNADGMNDILIFYNGGYKVYWNQGGNTNFVESSSTTGTNIGNVKKIWTGDFNGDGLPDFLMSNTEDPYWYFALNNGNGTFEKQLACSITLFDINDSFDDDKFHCQIFDFDLDGKSDVVLTDANYTNTMTCWFRSTGTSLELKKTATSSNPNDALVYRYLLGDFNGDGQAEIMNYGYNCYNGSSGTQWRMYKNSNFSIASGKIKKITDGFGNTTEINYASLASDTFYTKGSGSKYPVADLQIPIHAVKSAVSSNGAAGGNVTLYYKYGGLTAYLKGKGLLGMKSTTVKNTSLGTVTESEIEWDIDNGVTGYGTLFPVQISSKVTVAGTTEKTVTSFEVENPYNTGTTKRCAYLSSKNETDIYGNIVSTTYQYNYDYGYLKSERTYPANNYNTMYRLTEYSDYVLAGGRYQPQIVTTTQKHSDDSNVFSLKTRYYYNTAKGYAESVITNYLSSKPLTSVYTYDAFGNLKSSKSTGSNITPLTEKVDYDATNRFVSKKYTEPVSTVTTYSYDIFGNLLAENDESVASNILSTTNVYDNWGNLTSTTLPDGTKTTFKKGWGSTAAKKYFTLTQGTGQPWIKTWYDSRGREVLTESRGAKDITISKSTEYFNRGLPEKIESKTGNITNISYYSYDIFQRVTSFYRSATGQSTYYGYGNRCDTVISAGRQTVRTYDSWGNLKTVKDPVSLITYLYYSNGKQKSVNTGNATFTMEYYDTGKQKKLIDPDAGTVTFNAYDALGRVLKQSDARSKVTESGYDVFGRLTRRKTLGFETIYEYGRQQDNNYFRLIKERAGNDSISYSYDNLGRLQTETRNIENEGSFSTTYGYNASGQLSTITYPDVITVSREYDSYGNFVKTMAGTTVAWELTGNTGTVRTTKIGHLTATETRDSYGQLVGKNTMWGSTATAQDLTYIFDSTTGNLTYRGGMTSQPETFVYDASDRLTAVQQNGTDVMNVNYQDNGNISFKTGIGDYTYGSNHAVNNVDNTDGLLRCENQQIIYNGINKVSAIIQNKPNNNLRLDFTYGTDRQRWKTSLVKNGVLAKKIIFAGDMERVITGNVTRDYYYISGGDGLVAIYVKAGTSGTLHRVITDHLGSIVRIIGSAALTTSYKAEYDAWGSRKIISSGNAFPDFHRGYTGHEHLKEFGLINTNGRLYDPQLARFLQPDPFVQFPDNSQTYNRYSYCLNNPLKYTDPSGEFFDLVFKAFFFLCNYATNPQAGAGQAWQESSRVVDQFTNYASINVYNDNNTTISLGFNPLSFGFYGNATYKNGSTASNLNAGFSLISGYYGGTGVSKKVGEWNFGFGIGAGNNYWGWNASATYKGFG
ncbi:MAG: FG-GAP-like repeat-containing protein, partial [Dysgonamonadaceae bacterium]|nr:FG-GAP-like repeat-containing protein [Dysgonamonadaceae bacterium]